MKKIILLLIVSFILSSCERTHTINKNDEIELIAIFQNTAEEPTSTNQVIINKWSGKKQKKIKIIEDKTEIYDFAKSLNDRLPVNLSKTMVSDPSKSYFSIEVVYRDHQRRMIDIWLGQADSESYYMDLTEKGDSYTISPAATNTIRKYIIQPN
jgi:hypothetical protein